MLLSTKPESFKVRSDLHLARKIWHVTAVLVVAYFYALLPRNEALRAMAWGSLVFVPMDILRLRIPALNDAIVKAFQMIMRRQELKSLAGTTYLITGVFTIMVFFPKPVVLLTLCLLAVGDPVASFFGVKYGTQKIVGVKTVQGTVAAFAFCAAVGALFYYFYPFAQPFSSLQLIVLSLLTGLIGAVAELIPIGKLDDNLTFPLISSVLLYGLLHVFGGLPL